MQTVDTYKEDFLTYLNSQVIVKEPVNLYNPVYYMLQLGGKKLRPILTILTCDLFNGDYNKSFDAALAVEVFHNFTLIHDDIMDNAPLRRGEETVHKKWDVNTGILSGDAMMIMAYKCFESYEPQLQSELLYVFNKAALEVCEGQQFDVDFETRNDVTIVEYIKMITYKTSILVAVAMQMGAIIANAKTKEAEAIYNFGLNLGIAFQLQDDYLDTFGDSKIFGKQIGGDILENKKTFLFLKCLEIANDVDKNDLLHWYGSNSRVDEKVEAVTNIFKRNQVSEQTIQEIKQYTQKAFSFLDQLSITEDKKEVLKNFGKTLMKRSV
ncbi:MAG: polyprenyl synthetase family protein [Lutibacter sp.]|nr:polyprenyl synthetase family protein [Lutibacter sp.]MDP3313616.1 polyprenyl synthetase family protein [Lutibacter sp.]